MNRIPDAVHGEQPLPRPDLKPMGFGIVTPVLSARATFKACAASVRAQCADLPSTHIVCESAADKGEIDLDGAEGESKKKKKGKKDKDGKTAPTEEEQSFKPLFDYLADRFKETVKTVRLSERLTESACCLVADEHAPSAHMERVMKAFNQKASMSLRILELNPKHPVLQRLLELAKADAGAEALADAADLLYGQARLAEGSPIDDPARFNKLVSAMMLK